jgi:acid stress chaperone HdeB
MNPKLVVSGLIIVAGFATSAHAQVTIDASKITCEQFAFSKIASVRSIALWLSGYYGGKKSNPIINLQAFEENADKVESFCKQQKNLKLPVMQAVEQVLGKKQ